MPLDGRNWKPETETKPDLSKPSLEGLSWLLRHMPATHRWNFNFIGGSEANGCGSAGCALGLAKAQWGAGVDNLWGVWGVNSSKALSFFNAHAYCVDPNNVTPSMVADRIDEFLRSQKTDAYLAETRK